MIVDKRAIAYMAGKAIESQQSLFCYHQLLTEVGAASSSTWLRSMPWMIDGFCTLLLDGRV